MATSAIDISHFRRAAYDIGKYGDNDTLPFDVDNRFIADKVDQIAQLAFEHFDTLRRDSEENSKKKMDALGVFAERLLTPTGPAGFRITTKANPFWNVYFNGLAVGIAAAMETNRSAQVGSYRFCLQDNGELFDRSRSWREHRQAAALRCSATPDAIVVQTDISSFYERVSHHYLENLITDLFNGDTRVAKQVVSLLGKFSSGRSFGLPVGGQGSRILAELFLNPVDHRLTEAGLNWHRYVDDYVLIADSQASAYKGLSILSHALADYGITLNRTKTTFLPARHFVDYVDSQLGVGNDDASKLKAIDLHFDPYSDAAITEYESLKETVESLEVQKLLALELAKAQPDTFLIGQIGRTLRLQPDAVAMQLCETLLGPKNLHAFRASWATIMRGVSALRADQTFSQLFDKIDALLDEIPTHSSHLLQAEASLLHYLRTIRFVRTTARATFVRQTFEFSQSDTVKRGCIDCWRKWKDRSMFTFLRNKWSSHSPELQRLVWLAAHDFGDEGSGFMRQVNVSLENAWRLGIEKNNKATFAGAYREWSDASHSAV
jgi:hypothetical protein